MKQSKNKEVKQKGIIKEPVKHTKNKQEVIYETVEKMGSSIIGSRHDFKSDGLQPAKGRDNENSAGGGKQRTEPGNCRFGRGKGHLEFVLLGRYLCRGD